MTRFPRWDRIASQHIPIKHSRSDGVLEKMSLAQTDTLPGPNLQPPDRRTATAMGRLLPDGYSHHNPVRR
jgi:hypothetical protein